MKTLGIGILFLLSFALYSCGKTDGVAPSQSVATGVVISPIAITVSVGNVVNFSASGGSGSYSYSVFSGSGSILSTTGVFTAPIAAGSATVRVIDSLGATATAIVTINPALSISPASQTVAINSVNTFSGSNGVSPYTYSLQAGTGSVNSSTGAYTAPGSFGSATVRVTDSIGNTADAAVTITGPLVIAPTSVTLAVGNSTTLTGSGGTPPLSYSLFSGGGSVVAATGVYTAGATAGSAVVRVTDSLGATADSNITINAALAISPASQTLTTNSTVTFSTVGGVSPFTFSKVSGIGSIDSVTGLYTAPASSGSAIVRVTDSLGNFSNANVTVTNVLTISPATPVYVVTNGSVIFSATGGTAPYTFSCVSGIIDPQTGDYVAPAAAGSDTCKVTDSVAATSSATVTVYLPLTLTPTTVTMAINTTQTFTASGGQGARTFSLVSGVGSINSGTGVYTAPAVAGNAVIQVADSIGNILQASIAVVSSLTITPRAIYLPVGSTVNAYTATLGTSPYTFSVDSGGGTIVAGTGVYTAASASGTGVVRVTDAVTNTDFTNVFHIVPVEIKSGWGYHVCALYSSSLYVNYKLKCWGYNNSGQLGYGDTNARGDVVSELGYGLSFVDLGTNKFVKKVALGWLHTCAILNDDSVKCWGANTYGQLGYGNTTFKGNTTGQMGDNLPAVNLGTGRTAKNIYAFGYRTCAILDNNSTKCWGRNITGQLGLGNVTNYGSSAGQMGDSLPVVNFGTGRTAVKLAGSENTSCALLDNGSVKCWGLGASGSYSGTSYTYYGELGLETNNKSWGIGAGEMGDFLPTVNLGLGVGETITDIAGGRAHYCASISTGTVKCWGRNNRGQLGIDNTTQIGDVAGTMGASLSAAIGVSSVSTLSMMRESSCATLSGGTAKCWGRNSAAQLLTGASVAGNAAALGDQVGEMAALTTINFGTGRSVSKLAAGYYFGCAILDNNKIKCWGATSCGTGTVSNGCLLTGSTTSTIIGDAPTGYGDNLSYVNH